MPLNSLKMGNPTEISQITKKLIGPIERPTSAVILSEKFLYVDDIPHLTSRFVGLIQAQPKS